MVLEDGFEPPAAHGFSVPLFLSELLQQFGPDPRDRTESWRFCKPPPSHLARSGRLAPGEGFKPSLRGSEPRVLPLDDPGAIQENGAPDGNRTRLLLFDKQTSPPADREGDTKTKTKSGGGAPGRIRTSTANRPRFYKPLGSLTPEPARASTTLDLACHAYSVFKVRARNFRAKEKGPGVARPFVGIAP